jgi:isocitrate/isopropylmalate dehydrogenase
MMLDWLGESTAARMIRTAVDRALAEGNLTPDVGGKLSTSQMTQAIVNRLE